MKCPKCNFSNLSHLNECRNCQCDLAPFKAALQSSPSSNLVNTQPNKENKPVLNFAPSNIQPPEDSKYEENLILTKPEELDPLTSLFTTKKPSLATTRVTRMMLGLSDEEIAAMGEVKKPQDDFVPVSELKNQERSELIINPHLNEAKEETLNQQATPEKESPSSEILDQVLVQLGLIEEPKKEEDRTKNRQTMKFEKTGSEWDIDALSELKESDQEDENSKAKEENQKELVDLDIAIGTEESSVEEIVANLNQEIPIEEPQKLLTHQPNTQDLPAKIETKEKENTDVAIILPYEEKVEEKEVIEITPEPLETIEQDKQEQLEIEPLAPENSEELVTFNKPVETLISETVDEQREAVISVDKEELRTPASVEKLSKTAVESTVEAATESFQSLKDQPVQPQIPEQEPSVPTYELPFDEQEEIEQEIPKLIAVNEEEEKRGENFSQLQEQEQLEKESHASDFLLSPEERVKKEEESVPVFSIPFDDDEDEEENQNSEIDNSPKVASEFVSDEINALLAQFESEEEPPSTEQEDPLKEYKVESLEQSSVNANDSTKEIPEYNLDGDFDEEVEEEETAIIEESTVVPSSYLPQSNVQT